MLTSRAQQYQATSDLVELATLLGHSVDLTQDSAEQSRFKQLFQEVSEGAVELQFLEQYHLFQQAYLSLQEQLTTLNEVAPEAPREVWQTLFEIAVKEARQLDIQYQKMAEEWHTRFGWPALGGDLKELVQRGEDFLNGKRATTMSPQKVRKPATRPPSASSAPPTNLINIKDLMALSDGALGETIRAQMARSPREYQSLAEISLEELAKQIRPLLAHLRPDEPLLARQYALFRNRLRADRIALPLINLAFCLGRPIPLV